MSYLLTFPIAHGIVVSFNINSAEKTVELYETKVENGSLPEPEFQRLEGSYGPYRTWTWKSQTNGAYILVRINDDKIGDLEFGSFNEEGDHISAGGDTKPVFLIAAEDRDGSTLGYDTSNWWELKKDSLEFGISSDENSEPSYTDETEPVYETFEWAGEIAMNDIQIAK